MPRLAKEPGSEHQQETQPYIEMIETEEERAQMLQCRCPLQHHLWKDDDPRWNRSDDGRYTDLPHTFVEREIEQETEQLNRDKLAFNKQMEEEDDKENQQRYNEEQ